MKMVSRKEARLRRVAAREQQRREANDTYFLTQGQLKWKRFKKNKLAIVGGIMLILIYLCALFCDFLAPYSAGRIDSTHTNQPPQALHFWNEETGFSLRPFVYPVVSSYDPVTFKALYEEDQTQRVSLRFFVEGEEYKLLGLFPTNIHLFGVQGGNVYLFGTDSQGRDLFSRVMVGTRISSTVGLVGVLLSFFLGLVLGGISGYFGGWVDQLIQRLIDFTVSLPTIPLWMALAAAVPANWPVTKVYFAITIILSLLSWPGLARTVRSKLMSLKNEEYVKAAMVAGASDFRVITRHMLPMFMSHLIASLSLSIPNMILGETSLSFLGIGLRAPAVSWGVLLYDAQKFRNVALYPWTLIPGIFVIITVMSFNFIGDGLRDATDPNA